jgi:hypothetical protein
MLLGSMAIERARYTMWNNHAPDALWWLGFESYAFTRIQHRRDCRKKRSHVPSSTIYRWEKRCLCRHYGFTLIEVRESTRETLVWIKGRMYARSESLKTGVVLVRSVCRTKLEQVAHYEECISKNTKMSDLSRTGPIPPPTAQGYPGF